MGNSAETLQNLLIERGQTLSTAESCTGGRIAAALTAVAGSSAYFKGGAVTYDTQIKEAVLGVPHDLIERHGVVSQEVAEGMVVKACELFGTDFAVASTGVAGPGGGTDDLPVGTIWVACGNRKSLVSKCLHGDHGRIANVDHATEQALQLLLEYLSKTD